MLGCLLSLAVLFAAAYPLARALGLPWPTRLLATAMLGATAGPALAWITGVLAPAVRPDLPLLLLGLWGSVCLVRDAAKSRPWRLRPDRGQLFIPGAMVLVTLFQCAVVIGTRWERGNLVIANMFSHDALWHLAIAAMLRPTAAFATPWPPPNPVWADIRLTNYHPLTDVLVALLAPHRDQITAYFHVLPPLYGLIFTGGVAWVARQWGASRSGAAFTVLLAGLCGSLGHLVALLGPAPDLWDSAFWLSQPSTMCNNPPLSLSYGALLGGLAVLSLRGAPLLPRVLALGFLWGTSFGIKAYLPALLIPALAIAALLAPPADRRALVISLCVVAAGAFLMVQLTTRQAAGLLVYQPGWLLPTMLGLNDRLGRLVQRSLMSSPVEYRTMEVYAWAVAALPLFVVGNLGVRLAGLRAAWRVFCGKQEVAPETLAAQQTAFGVAMMGLALPILVKQRGVEWNTIQFAYFALVLLSLWAGPRLLAWVCGGVGWKRAARGLVLALLALPTTVQVQVASCRGMVIPAAEMGALRDLSRRVPVGGTIAIQPGPVPFRSEPRGCGNFPPTDPAQDAYVAAITGRPTYYADPLTLDILLLPREERLGELQFGLSLPEPRRSQWLAEKGVRAVYSIPPD